MTIEEARAHIGDGVVYTPAHGEPEDGVITSVNDRFVFVRYGSSRRARPPNREHCPYWPECSRAPFRSPSTEDKRPAMNGDIRRG